MVYLRELDNPSNEFTFPSEPNKEADVKRATNYQDFNFIGLGKRSYPKGMGAQPIKWNGYFWGAGKAHLSSHNTAWRDPGECIDQLEQWQEEGTPLNLIITAAGLNEDVTIQSFNYKPFGGSGDFSYDITLQPYKDVQIYSTSELGITQNKKKKKKTNRNSASGSSKKTYKVKSGDTLEKIAQRKYKSPSKWTEIYNANKKAIEAAAKEHGKNSSDKGKYIYPGTVLKIP